MALDSSKIFDLNFVGKMSLCRKILTFAPPKKSMLPRRHWENLIWPGNSLDLIDYDLEGLKTVAAPRGGLGRIRPPPNSQKSAKIVKEKWHKISWVYLYIEKLRQNPPPHFSQIFQSWRRHWLKMKLNMIIVAILVLRFLVKLRFPANTSIPGKLLP